MLFKVLNELFEGEPYYKLINTQTGAYAAILPQTGAILNELVVPLAGGEKLNVVQGYQNADELRSELNKQFRSVKLWPFPNRVYGAKYNYEGKSYDLPLNFPQEGNSIHGFLYEASFRVVEVAESSEFASLLITHEYPGDLAGFPFPAKVKVLYTFDVNQKLKIDTLVMNTGQQTMPMGDGWHAYFSTGKPIDELQLRFNPLSLFDSEDMTKMQGYEQFKKIGNQSWDHCFELDSSENSHELILRDTQLGIDIKIEQGTGTQAYNYLQIYTPPDRESIAIEPMSCPPDAFNHGIGLINLEPEEKITFTYSIQVEQFV